MYPGTSRFAVTGRYSVEVASFEIEQIDLIKRVARVAFTLKNHLVSIMRKIAFAGSFTFQCYLSGIGNKIIRNGRFRFIAAGLGVQSSKNRERDFKQGRASVFIAAGIVFTLLFMGAVFGVVQLVLKSAGN